LIPATWKIPPSATKLNLLSNSDNDVEEFPISEAGNSFSEDTSTLKDDSFTVEFDDTSFKSQEPPNLKGISSIYSTLTLSDASRPNDQSSASHDRDSNRDKSSTNTPARSHGLQWRLTLPSDFTISMGPLKYSKLIPVTIMEKDITKKIDYSFLPEETIIPSDQIIILPITITCEKDMASTFKGNIFKHKDFIESEQAAEYERNYFIKDISERKYDISSEGKITPAYADDMIISDDSGSEYVSDDFVLELEDKANNSFTKMSTLRYAPKRYMSHRLYTTVATSDSLSKATSSEFKGKENYQAIIPSQKNKNFDIEAILFKDPYVNVKTKPHRPTNHFLINGSKNPSRFYDKTSVKKRCHNGDDDIIIPSESSDFGNKIIEYSIFPYVNSVVDNRKFTTYTTNHAIKSSYNLFRENISPTIYKTFTPSKADTIIFSISDLLKMKQA
ncbi:hypothetical protein P7K49_006437, partial [Saguinus oedipus]